MPQQRIQKQRTRRTQDVHTTTPDEHCAQVAAARAAAKRRARKGK